MRDICDNAVHSGCILNSLQDFAKSIDDVGYPPEERHPCMALARSRDVLAEKAALEVRDVGQKVAAALS